MISILIFICLSVIVFFIWFINYQLPKGLEELEKRIMNGQIKCERKKFPKKKFKQNYICYKMIHLLFKLPIDN